jgi:hypothetical protein
MAWEKTTPSSPAACSKAAVSCATSASLAALARRTAGTARAPG